MDDVEKNTFEVCLVEWGDSLLFRDPQRWIEGLKDELAEDPKLEEKIKALSLQINVGIQSLLLDAGFNPGEIFDLMRLPSTAIDIIDSDGGLMEWRQQKQYFRS